MMRVASYRHSSRSGPNVTHSPPGKKYARRKPGTARSMWDVTSVIATKLVMCVGAIFCRVAALAPLVHTEKYLRRQQQLSSGYYSLRHRDADQKRAARNV
jgi:hypothetical protein